MTDVTEAGGDAELAAPVDEEEPEAGETDGELEGEGRSSAPAGKRSLPSNTVLLLGAILVIVIAQLVLTWFVFTTTTQLRDQYTAANGLQRCLIRAQLDENQTTDTSGAVYKAAVSNCIK